MGGVFFSQLKSASYEAPHKSLHQLAHVRQTTRNRGSSSHCGRHQVRAPTPALTTLKVTVRGRGTPLTRCQFVLVHSQTHRTARKAPFKTGLFEDVGQAFFFGLRAHKARPLHYHRADAVFLLFAFQDRGSGTQILNPTIGARPDKDRINGNLSQRRARS